MCKCILASFAQQKHAQEVCHARIMHPAGSMLSSVHACMLERQPCLEMQGNSEEYVEVLVHCQSLQGVTSPKGHSQTQSCPCKTGGQFAGADIIRQNGQQLNAVLMCSQVDTYTTSGYSSG